MIDIDKSSSFSGYIWQLHASNPDLRAKLPSVIPPWYFRAFFQMFERELAAWDGAYRTFRPIAADFAAVVGQYQQIYVNPTLDALRHLDPAEVAPDIRRRVNSCREDFSTFVRNYRSFAQSANVAVREDLFAVYFEVPDSV
jgi:hypothetical protein